LSKRGTMLRRIPLSTVLLAGALAVLLFSGFRPTALQPTEQEPSRLAVLWTSGDPEVATRVAFMYTMNAKSQGWFDEVTLIVWGPSAKLLAENAELQEEVAAMAGVGVEIVACKACADSYGVSVVLEGMGIEVKYMGQPLTEMLKGDWKVITF
jgi:hypothetical protein